MRSTTLEKFKGAVDRRALESFVAASPKQKLVILRTRRFLTGLQLRRLSQALDEAVAAGEPADEAFASVMDQFEKGDITVPVPDKVAAGARMTVAEMRAKKPGATPKQILLELRNAGAVSPVLTRETAQHMAKGLSLEQALIKAGAPAVAGKLAPDDEGADDEGADDAAGSSEDATEPGDGEAATGEPAPTGGEAAQTAQRGPTLLELSRKRVPDIEAELPKIEHKPAAVELLVLEMLGQDRSTAVAAIEKRAKELGATDQEITAALESAKVAIDKAAQSS